MALTLGNSNTCLTYQTLGLVHIFLGLPIKNKLLLGGTLSLKLTFLRISQRITSFIILRITFIVDFILLGLLPPMKVHKERGIFAVVVGHYPIVSTWFSFSSPEFPLQGLLNFVVTVATFDNQLSICSYSLCLQGSSATFYSRGSLIISSIHSGCVVRTVASLIIEPHCNGPCNGPCNKEFATALD